MTVRTSTKTIITFSTDELDAINRANDILESLWDEMNGTDADTITVNGTVYSKLNLREHIELLYDLMNDSPVLETDE